MKVIEEGETVRNQGREVKEGQVTGNKEIYFSK